MSTEKAIDSARPKSMKKGGIGKNRTARMPMIAPAKPTSRIDRRSLAPTSLAVAMSVMLAPPKAVSETGLDLAVDFVGESEDLRGDEGAGHRRHHQDGDDLGDEGERDFLNLGKGLEERNDDADRHRRADRRAGSGDHGPDRRLNDREGIGLIHGTSSSDRDAGAEKQGSAAFQGG